MKIIDENFLTYASKAFGKFIHEVFTAEVMFMIKLNKI